MKNYPVKWEGAVKAGKQMTDAIVEYIGGIEVVKAFSQSAGSYKKYSDAVNYNANYYVDWMRENQKTMSAYNAILPSVLICVLPCGFSFWLSGSLELSTFLSIVIFSLGLDWADYCGLYLYGRFGCTGDKCGRNQPASERRRTEP